jgi:uncharacterized caspase-like protein
MGLGLMPRRHHAIASWPAIVFAGLLAWLCLALPASAQDPLRGVALVIGNGDYEHLPKLPNPASDAQAIEALLDRLGFEIVATTDRDVRRLRRDLEDFVEDAEGADVAVLYYAGHGIEAGGQSFLVPVDADLAALDDAGERLVPLADIVAALQAKVPVTIVLLDACRTNPFPPGARLKSSTEAAPVPIAAAGLDVARGALPLAGKTADGRDNLGTVIGFAAAPGQPALDGAPDGNSPYAAALLKHFDSLSVEEFGTVMRLVAEEVYLRTAGRQRPWVNESLRRLLYFGAGSVARAGDQSDILAERRRLLLTIAALPEKNRERVEAVATAASVPMDALYGMLKALGAEAPAEPAELEKLLRSQTEALKARLAELAELRRQSDILHRADPKIARLSELIDEAIAEGALETARRLHEEAKARAREIVPALKRTESEAGNQLAGLAETFARSGEDNFLAFDYAAAAADFIEAFFLVERWDDKLAWRYIDRHMVALTRHADFLGRETHLVQAVTAGSTALLRAQAFPTRLEWAATQSHLGRALFLLGLRRTGTVELEQAVGAYRSALEEFSPRRNEMPLDWAAAQRGMAEALYLVGKRRYEAAPLHEAVAALKASLEVYSRERHAAEWATIQNDLGRMLDALNLEVGGTAYLDEAIAAFEAVQLEWTPERDQANWAVAQGNKAGVLRVLGEAQAGTAGLEKAAEAYRAAMAGSRSDFDHARAENGLGNVLRILGIREENPERFVEAIAAHRSALAVYRLDDPTKNDPIRRATIRLGLGRALFELSRHVSHDGPLDEAITAFSDAAGVFQNHRPGYALSWAQAETNLGGALAVRGMRSTGTTDLEAALAAWRNALSEHTRERYPVDFAWAEYNIGLVLIEIGRRNMLSEPVREGKAALQQSWDTYEANGYPDYDADFIERLADADRLVEVIDNGERARRPK